MLYKSNFFVHVRVIMWQVGGPCTFCGGSADKASKLTFAQLNSDGTFSFIKIAVSCLDLMISDSWGTEDLACSSILLTAYTVCFTMPTMATGPF